jgi:uncharacterized protein (TIGR03083 family)
MGIDYVSQVRRDAAAMADAARRGPLDAPVAACPGWDLNRLVGHVGRVHRWATAAVREGADPTAEIEKAPRDDRVVDYLEGGIAPLTEALAAIDPDAPAWNFTAVPGTAVFWPRRMAIETAIHRFDAEAAAALDPGPIDAALAVEGIDEVLEVWAPTRLAGRDGIDIGGSAHLHATDAEGEWTVRTDDGVLQVSRGHAKGEVALRGPAAALLLVLWRRVAPGDQGTEVFGDAAVLDRWLALPVP